MMWRHALWVALFGLAGLVAACAGGSGSSGFDVSPSAEEGAIVQALAEQRCVPGAGLTICPADGSAPAAATPPAGPPPSPSPTAPRVDTGLRSDAPLACVAMPGGPCTLSVPFAPAGFPVTATYRVAVRPLDPTGRWAIGGAPVEHGMPGSPNFDGAAGLDAVALDGPEQRVPVQVAVLVYLAPPASVPAEVEHLADSGADYAFVTPRVEVAPR